MKARRFRTLQEGAASVEEMQPGTAASQPGVGSSSGSNDPSPLFLSPSLAEETLLQEVPPATASCQPGVGSQLGSHDPNPLPLSLVLANENPPACPGTNGGLPMFQELGFSHALWYVMSSNGSNVLEMLGVDAPEVLLLREAASGGRLPTASAYAVLRPREPSEPRNSAGEDTDSGFPVILNLLHPVSCLGKFFMRCWGPIPCIGKMMLRMLSRSGW